MIGADGALVVIDLQADFLPGGALAVPDGKAVLAPISTVSTRFRTVVSAQDWHPAGHLSFASSHPNKKPFDTISFSYGQQVLWPDHCIQGSQGAELVCEPAVTASNLIVRKGCNLAIDSYSAFVEADRTTRTGLVGYLRDRSCTHLFLAGLATDFCVFWSALDAVENGFRVTVIEDAVRGIDIDGSLASAWRRMAEAGVACISSSALR